jgi:hypothetical protein
VCQERSHQSFYRTARVHFTLLRKIYARLSVKLKLLKSKKGQAKSSGIRISSHIHQSFKFKHSFFTRTDSHLQFYADSTSRIKYTFLRTFNPFSFFILNGLGGGEKKFFVSSISEHVAGPALVSTMIYFTLLLLELIPLLKF